MFTECHSQRNGWMDVTSTVCISHGGTWRPTMITYSEQCIYGIITRKESDRKVSVWSYVQRPMPDWTREFWSWNHKSMMKHKRTKREKITKVIILEMKAWGKSSRSADMVSNISSWNHSRFMLSEGRILDWCRKSVLVETIPDMCKVKGRF